MRKPTGLERLDVDFDSFFASAEQHLRPELRGRPVAVIPVDSEHTGLIAVSREAKALGLKRGTFVREARRQCPGLVLVTARHEAYVDLHRMIVAAVETVLPVRVVCSIDEMVCALLSVIAERLNACHRRTLLHWGPWVTIPGGYAGAKIAFNRIPDAEDF
jgi:DNA polymerase IV